MLFLLKCCWIWKLFSWLNIYLPQMSLVQGYAGNECSIKINGWPHTSMWESWVEDLLSSSKKTEMMWERWKSQTITSPDHRHLTLLFNGSKGPGAEGMGRWSLVCSWEMTGKSCENEILGPASKTSIDYEIQLDSLMRTEKKQIFFFNWHIFYYYKHIKMMSNMPYQMVYSNCQNKGWRVNNFPENLLKNSSSGKWQKSAMSSSTTQVSLKILRHHWLDGRESGWTPGVGDGQGGLACCDSWGCQESDTTERLNWTELKYWYMIYKGKEREGAFKLPSLKSKCPCTAQVYALKGKTRVSRENSEKVYFLWRMTWQLSTSPHLSRTLRY